ncbi:hypothetical protein INR49_001613 [Caranx melampygus]|nr:hypothetical protein INR49_001613 [Caranx melampygus]
MHQGPWPSELHFIHTFTCVPVQEGLTTEHGSELLRDAFEQLLDGCAVSNESDSHLEATGWNVTDSGLDIVGDPFDEVTAVLVLHVEHLLVNLLHGHAATEHGGDGQVTAMTWIACSHHILGIKHLLSELGNCEGTVLLAAPAGQWSKARHEEVQTRERHHVDSQFAEISIELTREAQASGDSTHGSGYQVVKVSVDIDNVLRSARSTVLRRRHARCCE